MFEGRSKETSQCSSLSRGRYGEKRSALGIARARQ